MGGLEALNQVLLGGAAPCRATNRLYLPERAQPLTTSALITVGAVGIWEKQVMGKVRCGSHPWELQWLWPDKGSHLVVQQTVIPTADRAGYIPLLKVSSVGHCLKNGGEGTGTLVLLSVTC